jgi:hypothetical protein
MDQYIIFRSLIKRTVIKQVILLIIIKPTHTDKCKTYYLSFILILLAAVYTTLSFSLNLLCFAAAIFGSRLLSVQNILPIIPMRKSNSFVFMLLLKPIHENHRNHKISICNISFVFSNSSMIY